MTIAAESLTAALLLAACAHMEAPPGGPPDTKKPYVAAVLPAPDTTGVSRTLKAEVVFSEWVNPDAERNKVYLNPPLNKRLRTKLDGNALMISSAGLLDTNTTYALGVLGTVRDLNGLPLEAPLQLPFSTGATLDSGAFQGRVWPFQTRPQIGAFAALYPRGSELRARFQHLTHRNDSIVVPSPQPDPAKERPAYIAPADSLGRFEFRNVRPGRYGLLGFQDVNGNLAADVGFEALAIGPSVDVAAAKTDQQWLTLSAYDTIPVRLAEVRWAGEALKGAQSSGTVRLKLNRPAHPIQSLRREAYRVRRLGPEGSPDTGAPVQVLGVCMNPAGEIELQTPPLDTAGRYQALIADLHDAYGNLIDTAKNRGVFTVGRAVDTTKPEMVFLGARKVSGEVPRLPAESLVPSRGMSVYYPRLLSDSLLADLRARLVMKIDTLITPYTLTRVSPHEFSLAFASAAPLKGQRLTLGLKPDSAALKNATGMNGAAPGSVAQGAAPGHPSVGQRAAAGATSVPQGAPAQPNPAGPSAQPAPSAAQGSTTSAAPTALNGQSAKGSTSGSGSTATAGLTVTAANPATTQAKPAAPAAPPLVPVASFGLADAAKLGSLKFKQQTTAYGSRLVIRGISAPWEFSRVTPAAPELTVDSLPEGWYAVDYFRDNNGDGIWNPGSLAPWAIQEPYVQWADSVQVKGGAINPGAGSKRVAGTAPKPDGNAGAKSDSTASDRRLAWPPTW